MQPWRKKIFIVTAFLVMFAVILFSATSISFVKTSLPESEIIASAILISGLDESEVSVDMVISIPHETSSVYMVVMHSDFASYRYYLDGYTGEQVEAYVTLTADSDEIDSSYISEKTYESTSPSQEEEASGTEKEKLDIIDISDAINLAYRYTGKDRTSAALSRAVLTQDNGSPIYEIWIDNNQFVCQVTINAVKGNITKVDYEPKN